MPNMLSTLGTLTLGGSAAVLVLALAGRSTRSRYGAKWRCWAWLLLCIRLALPVSLTPQKEAQAQTPIQLPSPSDTVIYHYAPGSPPSVGADASAGTSGTAPAIPTTPAAPSSSSEALPDESSQSDCSGIPEESASSEFTLSLSQAAVIFWLIGAAAMLLWTFSAHLRFLAYLRRWSVPSSHSETVRAFNQLSDQLKLDRRPKLLTCRGLQVPMLVGLARPVLLLPSDGLTGDALRYSLLHELTHYRRRDIWLKSLALWVNALHWFNPLVWYMVRLVERDTELACDEAALRQLPPEEHAAYGRTILDAAERLRAKSNR